MHITVTLQQRITFHHTYEEEKTRIVNLQTFQFFDMDSAREFAKNLLEANRAIDPIITLKAIDRIY